jgi:hypothetical protein
VYTATDPLGSTFSGTFDLYVFGHVVTQPGNYGDIVNPFDNGFDVFQQHQYPGAIVAGWTATTFGSTGYARRPVRNIRRFEPNGRWLHA